MAKAPTPGLDTSAAVSVALLGQKEELSVGRITKVVDGTIRLLLDQELPLGELVRAESDDHLLVGSVTSCEPFKDAFVVKLELIHSIGKPEFELMTRNWARPAKCVRPANSSVLA